MALWKQFAKFALMNDLLAFCIRAKQFMLHIVDNLLAVPNHAALAKPMSARQLNSPAVTELTRGRNQAVITDAAQFAFVL